MADSRENAILYETTVVEDHFHNRERWFGIATPQTAVNWGTQESLTVYQAVSGNSAFGVALQVLGTGDTPIIAGQRFFDIRRISIADVSNANPYILRLIWDPVSAAAGEAAGMFTEVFCQQATAAGQNKPQDLICFRIPCSTYQVWAKVKNGTNLATINFFIGVHGYDG